MRWRERGMVTVELAFASMFVLAASVALAWGLWVLVAVDRCQLVADEVARQAARRDQAAMAKVIESAPPGAVVDVAERSGEVAVTVRLRPSMLGIELREVELSSTVLAEARA